MGSTRTFPSAQLSYRRCRCKLLNPWLIHLRLLLLVLFRRPTPGSNHQITQDVPLDIATFNGACSDRRVIYFVLSDGLGCVVGRLPGALWKNVSDMRGGLRGEWSSIFVW